MFASFGHWMRVSAVRLESFKLQKYFDFATWPDVNSNRLLPIAQWWKSVKKKKWAFVAPSFGDSWDLAESRAGMCSLFAETNAQLIKLVGAQKVEMCFELDKMACNRRRKHTHGTPKWIQGIKTLDNDVFCPNSPCCASMANTFFVCFCRRSYRRSFD